MSTTNDLEFRILTERYYEEAAAMNPTKQDTEDPRCESWGALSASGPGPGEKCWGMYVKGTVAGAICLGAQPNGICEVRALILPRGRWGTGVATWMLQEALKNVRRGKFSEVRINLGHGGQLLGDSLADAGFVGPDLEAADFPKGTWIRPIASVRS